MSASVHKRQNVRRQQRRRLWIIWYEVSCFMYPFIVYKIVNIYVFEASNAMSTKTRSACEYYMEFILFGESFLHGEHAHTHTLHLGFWCSLFVHNAERSIDYPEHINITNSCSLPKIQCICVLAKRSAALKNLLQKSRKATTVIRCAAQSACTKYLHVNAGIYYKPCDDKLFFNKLLKSPLVVLLLWLC